MTLKRVLLVREGDFHIHLQQLAELLDAHGVGVEVLHVANAESEPLYRALIDRTKQSGIRCHLVREPQTGLERRLVALAFKLGLITKRAVITPAKLRLSRQALADSAAFDLIIAIDPASLFLACRLFPRHLDRIVEHSLEIGDESHSDFQLRRTERSFRLFERAMLPRIGGLIIQDRFRAEILLRHVPPLAPGRVIFYPVAINGPLVERPPSSQETESGGRKTILFFGGLWSEPFLRELAGIAEKLDDDQQLLVRGGRGTVAGAARAGEKFTVSTVPVPFDEVNDVIAAADVGLALYPNDEANSRRSAFAGEKVARYLQCGVPFVAFSAPDYEYLRAETGCCELVGSYAEVPAAIATILRDHTRYQRNARAAFERYYSRDRIGAQFLSDLSAIAQRAVSPKGLEAV